jgi:hypothetical protein
MSEQMGAVRAKRFLSGRNAVLVEMLQTLQAVKAGDFSVRMRGDWDGLSGKIADTFNDIIATNQRMANQLHLVGEVVGKEGLTNHGVAAKAMKGDRQKCLETGSSDDLAKPVDTEQLLSASCIWLHR